MQRHHSLRGGSFRSLGGVGSHSSLRVRSHNVYHIYSKKKTFHCSGCNLLTGKKKKKKKDSCFFSQHKMVARRENMPNTAGVQVNSLQTKHQQRNGRPRSVFFFQLLHLQVKTTESFNICNQGVSVTGRFCFKVSMRDKTPRFTLVVTLLVIESAGGGGGRTFCEGGRATKHF